MIIPAAYKARRLRLMLVFVAVGILSTLSYTARAQCTNCWEIPNPNFDPTDPYESDPECLTKPNEICRITGTPPTGQSDYTSHTITIGPKTESDPSYGDYAYVTYSGTEKYGKWNQLVAGDHHALSSNCERPLADNKTVPLLTVDLTVAIQAAIPAKFIEFGASLGHTWKIEIGGTRGSIYRASADCTQHCASRWLIKKMACGDVNGSYTREIYYGAGTRPIVNNWTEQDSNCTSEKDDRYHWEENSAFCVP
ncbi:MAG TPA: hypothetical protein PKE12_13930 [Kiritimatiellia bacterium]|nr:hypothetical protein [Kiritimatiellia bacterium]